ncbi:hypothetical protein AcW2_004170 [Taiwanofungus camphoratus]|nr:hypothetical protein AcW2_004170 [Antrodia cinnamomea]
MELLNETLPKGVLFMIASGVLSAVIYVAFRRYSCVGTGQTLPFPPGPPLKPFVGSILEVSPKGAWTKFTEYKQQYGDLVFFRGLGNNVLVLNSMRVINDFLDKRGNIYSHRPDFTVVGELMGLDQCMPLLPYGDEWRAQRKLAHVVLNPAAVKTYHVVQEDVAALLSKQLLDTPAEFFHHVRLAAGRIVLSVTYGLSVDAADHEYIAHAEETMLMIGRATVPGAFLCDLLPFLKYLPSWVPFHQEAKKGKHMIEQHVSKPYDHVKQEMQEGRALPSLTQYLLSSSEITPDFEHCVKWTAAAMYGSGGESTHATVLCFILAMALHPEKQRLAQAEIDNVVGAGRLPTIDDRSSLPYVNPVIKETMRWHPILPLSVARRSAVDDIYEGYFIPKSTIVMPNVWAVAFEPNERYDPHAFIPERFLGSTQSTVDPATWAFGFARRICPGKHLGENSLFILISTILAAFDVSPPAKGELEVKFTLDLVSYPEPFDCNITPRSDAKVRLINWRAAQSTI